VSQERERLQAYIQLFDQQLAEHTIQEIRDATIKSWVLGDAGFKRQIEQLLDDAAFRITGAATCFLKAFN